MKRKTRQRLEAAVATHPMLLDLLANPDQPDGGLEFDNFSTKGRRNEADRYTQRLDMPRDR